MEASVEGDNTQTVRQNKRGIFQTFQLWEVGPQM